MTHTPGGGDHPSAAEVLAELQDAMLPDGLPAPQQVQLAARYLLAEDYTGAGGDWFDAVPLPDGRVVLVVGDVVGHGVQASVVMHELKTLFEERVRSDGDVGAALALIDGRATRTSAARSTTLCVCVVDPAAGELAYCTAGHPPPVLVTAEGSATYLPTSGAGPLGSGQGFATLRHPLRQGDLLLLYSDGLVERPGRAPAQNTVELLRAARATVRGGPKGPDPEEQLVERVSRRVLELVTRRSGYTDDITLLAAQLVPATPPLELHLPALPDTVRAVRSDLGAWLRGLRVADLDRAALQHATGELISNAVAHAYPQPGRDDPVDLDIRLTPDGVVELTVSDLGTWVEPAYGDGGRGLALASGFLDELEVSHDDYGTCARGWYRISHPALLLRGSAATVVEPSRAAARIGAGIDVDLEDETLRLSGAIDLTTAVELRHSCARASRGGTRPVTVDLTEVDLLSSAAVQALFDASAAGRVDIVAPMGSPAQHVLDLVHLPYRS